MVLAFNFGTQTSADVRSLLRRRLLFAALVAASAFAAYVLVLLPLTLTEGSAQVLWLSPWYHAFFVMVFAAHAWVLWRRPLLSFRTLRALELTFTGSLMLYYGLGQYNWLSQEDVVEAYARRGAYHVAYLSGMPTLNWVMMIIAYGVLFPNTWRRCALVVAAMTLTAFAVNGAALARQAVEPGVAATYLVQMGIWLVPAGAIAVYGSHRIQVLSQQADVARKLGQYRLQRRLGAGGMGEVYLAEHVLLRRPCAVKLIRPERAGDPLMLSRFEREVRATATLTHPNSVQVFDYGHTEDGTFYYVMEFLAGLTLQELVERHGPLPPARAVHVLRQVCGALREAHAVGLIHRDIKPSNIMLCEYGGLHDVAKLLDFGLVVAQGTSNGEAKLTQEGAILGTPAYMSPEQVGGQDDLDARSDIYSLGAVAYFLLTGRPPFAGRSPGKMLAAHIYEQPVPLTSHRPDVPDELQVIVLRCLAKDPAERFDDAVSLEKALAGCHTVDQWSEEVAAGWWQSQVGPGGPSDTGGGAQEFNRTSG